MSVETVASYRDRKGNDREAGDALACKAYRGGVLLELGTMREFNSLSADAWAFLNPDEAEELAQDLSEAARVARQAAKDAAA